MMLLQFFVVVGVNQLLEVTAEDRRRIIVLSHGNCVVSLGALRHVHVAAHEIHQIGALHQ